MDDLRTIFDWHITESCLPAHTGTYLVLTHTGMVMETAYSKKYQKFMCSDDYTQERADRIESDYWMWAEKSTFLKKIGEEHWKLYRDKEEKKNDQTVFTD